jgi:hypothetical protein
MDITILICTLITTLVTVLLLLPALGYDIRIRGRSAMAAAVSAPTPGRRREKRVWLALGLSILSVSMSLFAAYHFFRARIVEQIVERPVDRVVEKEKLVPIQCPKAPIVGKVKTKPAEPIAAAPSPVAAPSVTNYAPNGFATSGGYLDHPTIYNGKPDRVLSADQRNKFIQALTGKKVNITFNYLMSVPDGPQLASDLCLAAQEAIPTTNCSEIRPMVERGPSTWYGVQLSYKGNAAPGQMVYIPPDSPAGVVFDALAAAGLRQQSSDQEPNMKDENVMVLVGPQPAMPQ